MARGDQIRARRGWYDHHGIDDGAGGVIHLRGEPGNSENAVIERISLARFSRGGPTETIASPRDFTPEEVIARAESRLGERHYDLLFHNCEHFARWCVTGVAESRQVEKAALAGIHLGVAARAGAALLARRAGLRLLAPILGPVGTGMTIAAAGVYIAHQLRAAGK